ncbi:MAG: PqqD family protein [Thermomicrobia bacterium]|nr:PqqD family protein [Thermomicrobia bacterium]
MKKSEGRRPAKVAGVLDELLADGSMVLFSPRGQQIITLNPTAALIWECCDGAHTVAAIADEVREVFPDAPAVERETAALLAQLREKGVVIDTIG